MHSVFRSVIRFSNLLKHSFITDTVGSISGEAEITFSFACERILLVSSSKSPTIGDTKLFPLPCNLATMKTQFFGWLLKEPRNAALRSHTGRATFISRINLALPNILNLGPGQYTCSIPKCEINPQTAHKGGTGWLSSLALKSLTLGDSFIFPTSMLYTVVCKNV